MPFALEAAFNRPWTPLRDCAARLLLFTALYRLEKELRQMRLRIQRIKEMFGSHSARAQSMLMMCFITLISPFVIYMLIFVACYQIKIS